MSSEAIVYVYLNNYLRGDSMNSVLINICNTSNMNLFSQKSFVWVLCVVVIVALIICAFMIRTKRSIEKFSILLFTIVFVGSFTLYFIGYSQDKENNIFISILRSIFSTGRLFLINDDYSYIKEIISDSSILSSFWYTTFFWTVHVLALLWLTLAILSIFGRKIIQQVILMLKFGETIYVICGANSRSMCLLNSLASNKRRLIIIIDEKANNAMEEKIQDVGAIFLKDRLFDEGTISQNVLKKIGLSNNLLKRKIKLFLFEDDEVYNISIAKAITMEANNCEFASGNLTIYVESNDKYILTDTEDTINCGPVKYNVNIINEADLAARRLMDEYPVIHTMEVDTSTATIKDNKGCTILIVGFGKIGREVLFKSLCNGQFVNTFKKPLPFNAIVVDSQWNHKAWPFRNMYPALEAEYPGIVYHPYSSNSDDFEKLLEEKLEDVNYIVIAIENDNDNLELAKNIKNFASKKGIELGKKIIAVHMRNQSNLFNDGNENSLFKNIKFFGEYESIFNEDTIINEKMDIVAQKINDHYNKTHGMDGKWVDMSLFTKNSNRSAATHLRTKLQLIGYDFDRERTRKR